MKLKPVDGLLFGGVIAIGGNPTVKRRLRMHQE